MKIEIEAHDFYKYLNEKDFIVSVLADRMGVSNGNLTGCFRHKPNRLGKPLHLSAQKLEKLNEVLPQIADELRQATITFGSDQIFTNSWGNTYDPATREAVLNVGNYFKTTPFLERVLGWKKGKRDMILVSRNSPVFGQVSKEDVDRINVELLSIAGVLSSWEVVPDKTDEQSPIPTSPDRGGAQTANSVSVEQGKGAVKRPWEDMSLNLSDRTRLWHEAEPDGVIFYRVGGGYTVANDDARRLAELDADIHPYTDLASGMVTAYMDADLFARVLPRCTAQGWRIAMTDMYSA